MVLNNEKNVTINIEYNFFSVIWFVKVLTEVYFI